MGSTSSGGKVKLEFAIVSQSDPGVERHVVSITVDGEKAALTVPIVFVVK